MKYVLAIIIIIHGAIHLMGFAKGVLKTEIEQLNMSISKTSGYTWLLAALTLIAGGVLYLFNIDIWLWATAAGVLLSAVLVFRYWRDAKFGMLANIIILALILILQYT